MAWPKEDGVVECAQMPDVIDALISIQEYPHLSEKERTRIKGVLLEIEGSPKDGGMTCIAKKDFGKIADIIKNHIGPMAPKNPSDFEDPDHMQAFIRSLDKSCDECLVEDCKIRLEWTRAEVDALSLPGVPKSYRRLRLSLPQSESTDELECA